MLTWWRSKIFDLLFYIWSATFILYLPFLAIYSHASAVRFFSRVWSGGVSFLLRYVVGLSYEIIGKENIQDGPALYVVNHQSEWETIMFNRLVKNCAIVLKEELFRIPVFGWYLEKSEMLGVDRGNMDDRGFSFMREAGKVIADGRSVVIFPEGTRVGIDDDKPFLRGFGVMHKKLGVKIVPVVHNAGIFWKNTSKIKHPGRITVHFMEPVKADASAKKMEAAIEVMIKNRKRELIDEQRQSQYGAN